MRLFDLFLRRAGVDRAAVPSRVRSTSRLTVECPRNAMSHLRKQICLDFAAAGLSVSQVEIDQGADLASACVTVSCPNDLRATLMDQARRLRDHPDVRRVRFARSAAA